MKRKELLQHLRSQGCELLREGSRHSWWHNPKLNKRSAVPRHSEISDTLAKKICKDLGIPPVSRVTTQREEITEDELRRSVGESFNIYQATVAMCSIFLGFVFAGLIQLLGADVPLTVEKQWIVRVLVLALLLLLGSLIGFHFTANQVVRYWRIFFPQSKARTIASVMFQLGIIAMLIVIALLLLSKTERILGWLVVVIALGMIPLVSRVGSVHRGALYVRSVDEAGASRVERSPPVPKPDDRPGSDVA